MKEKELVCYVLVHSHLSTIQKGVQAAHAVASLCVKPDISNQVSREVLEWASEHKTLIMLDGGNTVDLCDWHAFFVLNDIHSTFFREDKETLGGLVTAGAFVIDRSELKSKKKYRKLYNKLSGLPLAR